MTEEKHKVQKHSQDRFFELRNEKVRSIVGQIPSSLVRYGIFAIGGVLFSLFAIAYILPCKQIYSGTAIVYEIPSQSTDSLDMNILLRFENRKPSNVFGQFIYL